MGRMTRNVLFGGLSFAIGPHENLSIGHLNGILNMRDWLNAGLGPWMEKNRVFSVCAFGFGPMRWALIGERFNHTFLPFIKKYADLFNEGNFVVANPMDHENINKEIEYVGGMEALKKHSLEPVHFPIKGLSFPFAENPAENKYMMESPLLKEMVSLARNEIWHADLQKLSEECLPAGEKPVTSWIMFLANGTFKAEVVAAVTKQIKARVKSWALPVTMLLGTLFLGAWLGR